LLGTVVLASCAASPEHVARVSEYNRTIPTCNAPERCQRLWDAAQVWVSSNSAYRIQVASDAVIETYGPMGYGTALAMRVIKSPVGSTGYRFLFFGSCNNVFGCNPSVLMPA